MRTPEQSDVRHGEREVVAPASGDVAAVPLRTSLLTGASGKVDKIDASFPSGPDSPPARDLPSSLSTFPAAPARDRHDRRRRRTDRLATAVVWAAFGLALVPLVSLIWTTLANGSARIDLAFFTNSMRNVVGPGGGIAHALAGTLWITGAATAVSVPIGLLTAIHLVEYRSRIAPAITFLVDVMTGIPSIVAGLFAYGLMALLVGPGAVFGLAGSVALSVLMVPVIVRASEDLLRLVPDELREAAYALGVPRWMTILRVVLPAAASGLVSGVILALARVIGETAPLMIAAGFTASLNNDPTSGSMMTLPVFVYDSYAHPGVDAQPYWDRAWAAALTLIALVMLLNLAGRLLARRVAPLRK